MSFQDRLYHLQKEIDRLAALLGRKSSSITLVVVSKNANIQQMLEAYAAGVRHFGESKLQDALAKKDQMPNDVIWHFIGPIQSNKAAQIACFFDVIHSVASLKIAKIISEAAMRKHRKSSCFIQLNLSKEQTKQGFSEEQYIQSLVDLKSLQGLDLLGIMTIGPHTKDEERIRECFSKAENLSRVAGSFFLSMGMSQDYPIAIEKGATHLRIGSFLFL